MFYVLIDKGTGEETNLFGLEINLTPGHISSTIDFYVNADRADGEALRLSVALPDAVIALRKMARFKAFYQNGKRTEVFDYRDFYSNLTDEEYLSTKIRDSITAEMV